MSPAGEARARARRVREMFSRIAPRYDLANRVLSAGLDRRWRSLALDALEPLEGVEALDLCAGTMDLALGLLGRGAGRVVAVDSSEGMMERGRARVPAGAPLFALRADAMDLPLCERRFDRATCGFGLRNVPDGRAALGSCLRVLRAGGLLAVLEFFRPETAGARSLHAVIDPLLPALGGWITGDRRAYAYLARSIDAYLSRSEFEDLAREVGFEVASGRELWPPLASLVVLRRPEEGP